jgi:lysophospholipase L1-like esterase
VGLAPLALLEIGLGVAGWEAAEDPYLAGFDEAPIFAAEGDSLVVAPGHSSTWRARPFPATRKAGDLRIFAVGDSITWGHRGNEYPDPLRAWPEQLEERLRSRQPDRDHRVINCGARTFASRRVGGVLRQVLALEPDAVVVAAGTSEHLETDLGREHARSLTEPWWIRSFRVPALLKAWLRPDAPGQTLSGLRERDEALRAPFVPAAAVLADRAAASALVARARDRFLAMARACRAVGVPLVLATVPSNLRFPPLATRVEPESARVRVEEAIRLSGALLAAGQPAAARDAVAALARVHPEAAGLHFRLAQALDRLGQNELARQSFLAARDADACPARALGSLNEAIRQIARSEPGVFLAEVERRFEQAVPDRIPDDRLFLDNCHPTPAAHALMAAEVERALAAAGVPAAAGPAGSPGR